MFACSSKNIPWTGSVEGLKSGHDALVRNLWINFFRIPSVPATMAILFGFFLKVLSDFTEFVHQINAHTLFPYKTTPFWWVRKDAKSNVIGFNVCQFVCCLQKDKESIEFLNFLNVLMNKQLNWSKIEFFHKNANEIDQRKFINATIQMNPNHW